MKKINLSLNRARYNVNDEFYTFLEDIEKEVVHYESSLSGKIVYLNCDNYKKSNFYKFFKVNYERLELRGLLCSGIGGAILYDGEEIILSEEDCPFESELSQTLLEQCDVVITNPPFSLFRDYMTMLFESGKKFLIVGNFNSAILNQIFPSIKNNETFFGINALKKFTTPDENGEPNNIKEFGNVYWYTNIETDSTHNNRELLPYTIEDIEYDCIDDSSYKNVNRLKHLPDTTEIIAVPITYLLKHNPKQFKIVDVLMNPKINGKKIYKRVLIQRT